MIIVIDFKRATPLFSEQEASSNIHNAKYLGTDYIVT